MQMSRREFMQLLAVATAAGMPLSACQESSQSGQNAQVKPKGVGATTAPGNLYEMAPFGNVSLMHYTDCHAQLLPIYFREPNINLGIGAMSGKPPHLVGEHFLKNYNLKPGSIESHAFTYLDFTEAAKKFGTVGGFAHLATLVKQVRAQRPGSLLLDGGDTWGGGSGTAIWTDAQDMVDAQKLLGVDVMTGHWEFTYGHKRVKHIIENDFKGKIDFVAQNIRDKEFEERVFKPYVIREINGTPVAIIGQAFPYTPIANPSYLVPNWQFGIRDEDMQTVVNEARAKGAKVVIVLSHNGMDVDLKMAGRTSGIDAIMGGHTHDAIPQPAEVPNKGGGKTLVINSGSNGKFLSVLDLDVKGDKVAGYKYRLFPIFSNLIQPDPAMVEYINKVRNQNVTFLGQTFNMKQKLEEKLAIAGDTTLYRRGNFNGTFDQMICDALIREKDSQISFSPGFRWGVSVLPGQDITYEHVMSLTGLTYPITTRTEMTGNTIKLILEDVADNLFNEDPYYQQGGDMVRVGGLKYEINPNAKIGNRITYMEHKGEPLDANKKYVVAGWASIQPQSEGVPIWDLVSKYLRDQKEVKVTNLNVPKIQNVAGNLGMVE